jgi:hypothetical protein
VPGSIGSALPVSIEVPISALPAARWSACACPPVPPVITQICLACLSSAWPCESQKEPNKCGTPQFGGAKRAAPKGGEGAPAE